MTYEETDNVISLDKALPTTDKTGKKLEDYFEFTVTSSISGDTNINYEISAKAEPNNTFDGDNVKLYLTRVTDSGEEEVMAPEIYNEESNANNFTGRPTGEMSLYTSSMNASESNTYRLRMWVDENYNPQDDGGNKTFSVKVNVYGKDRVAEEVSTVLLNNIPESSQYDDGVDTFITGEDPNNYIWYSGKLWRAVSVANEAKTTKLVTQWNENAISYNLNNSVDFAGSEIETWLNDTSADGFLENLRDYENFIVTDAAWDATIDNMPIGAAERPDGTSTVIDLVGLLNFYEFAMVKIKPSVVQKSYLINSQEWWLLTPFSTSEVRQVSDNVLFHYLPITNLGVRPSINLKSNIKIADGDGTLNNPYRLEGDSDTNLSGTLLNTRYSGEYIRFGTDENNLYRIVSHESEGLTKITSAEPLKDSGTFRTIKFGDTVNFSSINTVGSFLNGEYLTNYVGDNYNDMIEDNTTWYLGKVQGVSYKLAKYTDETGNTLTSSTTTAKVGLLRHGELLMGQYDLSDNSTSYYLLTPSNSSNIGLCFDNGVKGVADITSSNTMYGIKPALNLKSNVVITSGTGTLNDPFTIELRS